MLTSERLAAAGFGHLQTCQILEMIEEVREERLATYQSTPIQNAADVIRRVGKDLQDRTRERFLAVLLDAKNHIIRVVTITDGTPSTCPITPRACFLAAVVHDASGVIFVHNHPSGDPTPSTADIALTRRLVAAGHTLDISVRDHIIVGHNSAISLAERGFESLGCDQKVAPKEEKP